MDKKIILIEFVKFGVVGTIATGLHYLIYFLLSKFVFIDTKIYTNIAYAIGYLISWFFNLYATAYFTFKTNLSVKKGVGFAVSHGVNFILHIVLLNLLLWLSINKLIAPVIVYCIVIPINFLLVRTVFKNIK